MNRRGGVGLAGQTNERVAFYPAHDVVVREITSLQYDSDDDHHSFPLQKRDSDSHNILMRTSLFLINSYVARLLIGVLGIVIISTGALVNMSQCELQTRSTFTNDTCNCTIWEKWESAVTSPSPDHVSCQFPQVLKFL